ncbi:HPr family phosphocarrier protein [Caldalkalibacillus mannanilyticus]|uniref:HPr family phosphocarrier protein n=1 Tax=Caldalkalibacillus mannanilyticus TaxID=1418 RepID=UPI00054F7CE1|nr:HPr family phosphocarrier protein [Caldalkalibacillus mannanilyticus]
MNEIQDRKAMKIANDIIELDTKRNQMWEQLISILGQQTDQVFREIQNGLYQQPLTKYEKKLTISKGLTIKEILLLVDIAEQFESTVYFQMRERNVNGKNILGLSSLMATIQGETEVLLKIEGMDAEYAMTKIVAVMNQLQSC